MYAGIRVRPRVTPPMPEPDATYLARTRRVLLECAMPCECCDNYRFHVVAEDIWEQRRD